MEPSLREKLAQQLTTARLQGQPIAQLSGAMESFARHAAYQIQQLGIEHRLAQGEKQVGFKMGLTSEAKRQQMNLDAPLYGELTDHMQVLEGGSLELSGLIHPKIEPEVAFFITSQLAAPVTKAEVWAACGGVAPALEILDSRYLEFKYFSMEDVISDNSSSAYFVLGKKVCDTSGIDLSNLSMEMMVNGKTVERGNASAISGNPVQSVVELCQLLAQQGRVLPAKSWVLAGAATAAVSLEAGMAVSLRVEHLGEASVTCGSEMKQKK